MAQAYCRKCADLVDDGDFACPRCGAIDPARARFSTTGLMFLATLAAGLLTAGYAYAVSLVWERWEEKFDHLPAGATFQGAGWEVAVGIGVGVFVVAWSLVVLAYWSRQSARRRGADAVAG